MSNKIHPSAFVAPSAILGDSLVIGANATVGLNAMLADRVQIGDDVIIHDAAQIGFAAQIGNGSQIGCAARIAALCQIPSETVVPCGEKWPWQTRAPGEPSAENWRVAFANADERLTQLLARASDSTDERDIALLADAREIETYFPMIPPKFYLDGIIEAHWLFQRDAIITGVAYDPKDFFGERIAELFDSGDGADQ
jgi:carbonic anhydrase/acetyltransferase-like protein (isoleucine patch superfamily)